MAKNSYSSQQLVLKMKNPDADLRFMALTDLITDIQKAGDAFGVDDATEHSVVEQVLSLMNDQNGEVKNLSVKTLAALIKHVSDARTQVIIDRLISFTASKDEGVRDIASLGLKTVVAEITPSSALAQTACTKLAPKVVSQLEDPSSSSELLIDSLELLGDIVSRFEANVKTMANLQASILTATTPLLSNGRAAVRKRAVNTLATLIASSDVTLFDTLISGTVLKSLKGKNKDQLKTAVSLVGALAKFAPQKMGKKAAEIVPLVLKSAGIDDDELREGALQALESLVLKCPTEVGPSMTEIVDVGTSLIKYDPNYAGGDDDDDEDVEMGDASDEDNDEDDEFGDEYSDDDDTSWKVRRSATKLLGTCILTRSDLLSYFYKVVSPALIARFGEREETVKVEIWATYTTLLSQTKVWGSSSQAREVDGAGGRLKRKRSMDVMETDEGPVAILRTQTPAIAKSIIKQLSAKSLATRQSGFTLLHELIAVLDGGLESQLPSLVLRIENALKSSDSGLSGAATTLKIEVLSFVGLLVRTHHAKTFSDELPKLVPLLVSSVGDKFNKIAAEAFVSCADLVRVLRPVVPSVAPISAASAGYLKNIYDATMGRLSSDADEEVKGKGIQCLGSLLFHAGDQLTADFDPSFSYLRDRLKNEASRLVAVKVVSEVAESPVLKGPKFDVWVQECLVEVSALLRKVHRPLKVAAFGCIKSLLDRSGTSLSSNTAKALLADLTPLVNDADINLLPMALTSIATILDRDPAIVNDVQISTLPRAYQIVQSPLLQGPSLDALLSFFSAFVRAGAPSLPILQVLSQSAETAKKTVDASGTQSGMQSLATSSRCIGVIVRQDPSVAEVVVKEYSKNIKAAKTSPAGLILGLLTLGEIGRTIDLGGDPKTFEKVVEHFSASAEDVRRSAAFAAGNMTVGNPGAFLPTILKLIQSDDKKRYLALQALKEVIVHSPPAEVAKISDELWTPLFENCEAQEEGTRNVAADCLGQLTILNPTKYLPQLQARLHSKSHYTRATVIAAIRFTFTNNSTAYDELLAPLIVEFFKLIHDSDLGVRRLALSTLNSAAHNKPHLVRDQLATLLPELYAQTEIDESLIRMVEMGPFKHKVDDGLDIRKTAYECMHTLLDSCLKEIEIHEFLRHVLAGLNDEEEVKKLSYLMLVKLSQIAPTAVTQRLDEAVPPFEKTIQTTLKESAVKQETERLAELQKAALRCLAVLNRLSSPTNTPKFHQLITGVVLNGKMASDFKELASVATTTRVGDAMDVE